MQRLVPILLLTCAFAAQAHEVRHHIAHTAEGTVITLTYGNGKPFANERYAIFPQGAHKPLQTGRTDATGRVVFSPGATGIWRMKAFSANGHGSVFDFTIPAPRPAQ